MAKRGRIALRLATQVLLLQLVIVTLTLLIAFGLYAAFNRQRLDVQYHVHSLDIARVVASSPTVLNNITNYDDAPATPTPALIDQLAAGPIQAVASRVEARTHVLFVVIANTRGIRLATPRRDELGLHVRADLTPPLAGREETSHDSTVYGQAIVGKVPVIEPGSGRVLGGGIVGMSTKEFGEQFVKNLRVMAAMGGVLLVIGAAGSAVLARRWRGLT